MKFVTENGSAWALRSFTRRSRHVFKFLENVLDQQARNAEELI
jgi:hypothetical protein